MFVIVQNDPDCPPGTLPGLLTAAGHDFTTIAAYGEAPLPDPAGVTGVIVLGGEMGVHDTGRYPHLLRVLAYITRTLEAGTPLLGICLGGQLVAKAAGGVVHSPSPHGEQGISPVELNREGVADPLLSSVPNPFLTFQLHNDSFELPPGAVLLAGSRACPAQAFRLGEHAYGLQFHPEVDREIVSAWGALSSPPEDFLTGFLADELPFRNSSHPLLANFISLAARSPR